MADVSTRGRFVRDGYSHSGIIPRREINRITRMLNSISFGRGISGVVTPWGIRIESSSAWNGTVRAPDGVETTGLNSDITKPYIKFTISTNTFSQETGPEPIPWPDNEIWWEKREIPAGTLYVYRLP